MSQAAYESDNFRKELAAKYSQGPELDTTAAEENLITKFLDNLPSEMTSFIEAMDPFTRRALEIQILDMIKGAKDIANEASSYVEAYESWAWQYDETPLFPAPEALAESIQRSKARRLSLVIETAEQRDTDEALAQQYCQAVSEANEQDGWLPMPHFARERDILPEARSMIREVKNDIEKLGEE